MKSKAIFFLLSVIFTLPLHSDANSLMKGLDHFRNAEFVEAVRSFREVILDSHDKNLLDDAYFWTLKSYVAMGELSEAKSSIDFFIENFRHSPYIAEVHYEAAYIHYLNNDYNLSIQKLYTFIQDHPQSKLVSSSYYIIAEALYQLGQLDKALQIFDYFVKTYPQHKQVGTALYRMDVIRLKHRETELLRLIRISHEDYIDALDEFQRRELAYAQALQSAQKRIRTLEETVESEQVQELLKELTGLENKNQSLESTNATLRLRIVELQERLAELDDDFSSTASDIIVTEDAQLKNYIRLLEIKEENLKLKEAFVNRLLEELGESQ